MMLMLVWLNVAQPNVASWTDWDPTTASAAEELKFASAKPSFVSTLGHLAMVFGGPNGVPPLNSSRLISPSANCATPAMRGFAKIRDFKNTFRSAKVEEIDELVTEWNAIPGVNSSHMMPWYDSNLWEVMQKHGPKVGFNGLLRALPRMGSCLSPWSHGDPQGMMMHWLGTWVVRGALNATAKEALKMLASIGTDQAFSGGRGLTHGIVWSDLEIWVKEQGIDSKNMAAADKKRIWGRAVDACSPEGFRCRFFFVSCVHGIGHAFQRITHNPKHAGYRQLGGGAMLPSNPREGRRCPTRAAPPS